MRFVNLDRPRWYWAFAQLVFSFGLAGFLGIGLSIQKSIPFGVFVFFVIATTYSTGIWWYWITVDEVEISDGRIAFRRRGKTIEGKSGEIEYYEPVISRLRFRQGIEVKSQETRVFVPGSMDGFIEVLSFLEQEEK